MNSETVIARKNRIDRVRQEVNADDAQAVLLTFLPDIRWACGFTGSNGLLLILPEKAHFVTDGRYRGQAHREVGGAEVHIASNKLFEVIQDEALLPEEASVGYQSDHVTVDHLETLRNTFDDASWVPMPRLLWRHVASKEAGEIERICAAQRITDRVFEHICDVIALGKSEQEIAAEIVYAHLKQGAEKMSFDPIVASGPNGSLPHARPTNRLIQEGDLVVIDMGCFLEGYASDMTRTVAVGEPTTEARSAYQTVLEAQEAAINAAHAGMTGQALDAVARSLIEEAGFGEYFSHSLGHGVGLQIHEWPRVSKQNEEPLPEGAVVSIEPGVYVPEAYGIRIEDLVVLQEDGCENLTGAPKALRVL